MYHCVGCGKVYDDTWKVCLACNKKLEFREGEFIKPEPPKSLLKNESSSSTRITFLDEVRYALAVLIIVALLVFSFWAAWGFGKGFKWSL